MQYNIIEYFTGSIEILGLRALEVFGVWALRAWNFEPDLPAPLFLRQGALNSSRRIFPHRLNGFCECFYQAGVS